MIQHDSMSEAVHEIGLGSFHLAEIMSGSIIFFELDFSIYGYIWASFGFVFLFVGNYLLKVDTY